MIPLVLRVRLSLGLIICTKMFRPQHISAELFAINIRLVKSNRDRGRDVIKSTTWLEYKSPRVFLGCLLDADPFLQKIIWRRTGKKIPLGTKQDAARFTAKKVETFTKAILVDC
jgi:hypothetical protein